MVILDNLDGFEKVCVAQGYLTWNEYKTYR